MNSTTNEILPEGYKMTELGPLPEEWEVVRLGEVADFFLGRTPKRAEKSYWDNGKYSWISIADMKDFGFISKTSEKVSQLAFEKIFKENIVPKGTLIMSFKLTIGRTAILNIDALHNEAIISIYPKGELLKEFLFYFLPTIDFSNYYDNVVKGKTLNSSKIKNLLLPLPPLPEQQKIAAVLSAVQEAKEKTQAVIDATKVLKKSMMKHLFTYGPVPPEETENVPLKETEIGKVPEDWEVEKLGDLSTKKLIKVQFGFPCGKWNDKGIGIAQVRPFNINENGNIDLTVLKYIETDNDIGKYLLQKEDIIFNNTNSEELVGKTAFWKDGKIKYVLSNHMTIIRIVDKSKLNAYFLAKYLHKRWNDGFYKTICRRHVNQSSISLARLNDISLPLPPLPVQQKIASILSAIDAKIEAEENKKQALEELFKTLLHNLMTAKIRVNHLEIKV